MNKMQLILFIINQSKRQNKYLKNLDSNTLFKNANLCSKDKIILKKIIDFAQTIKQNKYYLEKLGNGEFDFFGFVGIGLSSEEIAGVYPLLSRQLLPTEKKIKELHLSGSSQLQKIAFQYLFLQLRK